MNDQIREAGTVILDGKPYRLVRPKDDQIAYKRIYIPESPYNNWSSFNQSPKLLPELVQEEVTWHQGGFKSHPGVDGTTEYGQDSDGRWPYRLLPAGARTNLTLTSSAGVPTSIVEFDGYIMVTCGRRVYRIDPSADTVVISKDFGSGGVLAVDAAVWSGAGNAEVYYVTTNEGTQSLYDLLPAGLGGGSGASTDLYNQTPDVKARYLAGGVDRLFKITADGQLKDCVQPNDPMSEVNWGDSVQIGLQITVPTALVAYLDTVFIGKPEGFFAVGTLGRGIPQIRRMARDVANCIGTKVFDPYILIPHSRGIYRYYPGQVDSVGLETETLNESAVRGRTHAIAPDGNGFYFFVDVGSTSYLCYARERKGQEPGFGPYILDTLNYISTGNVWAAKVSSLTSPPRLWFGNGNNISYIKLSADGGAPDVDGSDYRFVTSGVRYGTPIRFDDWQGKDWMKVQGVGDNCDASNYWALSYKIDGGAEQTVDINGSAMRVNSTGLFTFYLPTTAIGVTLQPIYRLTSAANTNSPRMRGVKWYAVPATSRLIDYEFSVYLESGLRHDEGIDNRTAANQLSDLEALLGAVPGSVLASGPWGNDKHVWLRELEIQQGVQDGTSEYNYLVQIRLQERQGS